MAGKLGVGAWAGLGSILGLFAGSLVGAAMSKGGSKGAASVVLPALAGTALGAFAGAALTAAEPNTTTVTTTTTGAGALPPGVGKSGYITVPGYPYPIGARFDPKSIDTSSGEPIVRTSDGYWVWGRGCTQPGGGIVPAWGFVKVDVVPAGVGAAPMSAADAVVERYDPKRYAGREPPHRCTAASATAIAQQLPGAPWVYAGVVANHDGMKESTAPVITPMGSKTIPYWTDNLLPSGYRNRGTMPTHLVIQCPFTGEQWSLFSKSVYA